MTEKELLKMALGALQSYNTKHVNTYGLDGAWDEEITNGTKAITAIQDYFGDTQIDTEEKCNLKDKSEDFAQPLKKSAINVPALNDDYLTKAYRLADELRNHLSVAPRPVHPVTGADMDTIEHNTRGGNFSAECLPKEVK